MVLFLSVRGPNLPFLAGINPASTKRRSNLPQAQSWLQASTPQEKEVRKIVELYLCPLDFVGDHCGCFRSSTESKHPSEQNQSSLFEFYFVRETRSEGHSDIVREATAWRGETEEITLENTSDLKHLAILVQVSNEGIGEHAPVYLRLSSGRICTWVKEELPQVNQSGP